MEAQVIGGAGADLHHFARAVLLAVVLHDLVLKLVETLRAGLLGHGELAFRHFAGAADELSTAIRVNPHDIEGVKDAIMDAVEMPPTEQRKRMRKLRRRVQDHDVVAWSRDFLAALAQSRKANAS